MRAGEASAVGGPRSGRCQAVWRGELGHNNRGKNAKFTDSCTGGPRGGPATAAAAQPRRRGAPRLGGAGWRARCAGRRDEGEGSLGFNCLRDVPKRALLAWLSRARARRRMQAARGCARVVRARARLWLRRSRWSQAAVIQSDGCAESSPMTRTPSLRRRSNSYV